MFIFIVILISYLIIMLLVAIGVVGWNPGAIKPMMEAPRQFPRLLISRRMRRNHALEHATINVLEQRYGRTGLTGMPAKDGFHLRGRADPHAITTAAQEAIRRLSRGERQLATSRRCPTSLISTQLVLLILFVGAMFLVNQGYSAPLFLAAVLGAALLGPPLSPYLQRLTLIDPNPDVLAIRDVEYEEPTSRLGMLSFVMLSPVFVRTAPVGGRDRSGRTSGGETTLITGNQEEIPAGRYRLRE